ncbi:hypothetical protein CPB85DRAFT_1298483 [Mucidula mucida]|nr:hypothetical protein CPB85DRAFT_1298483 [Mucidula mucida]
MANKVALVSGSQTTLQRGKACLRCRKRKMRCDGTKPACQQCIRAKKGDGCEYDDGKGKTRTQILKETIARLETRIRELEDPEYVSPAITLHDPHIFHHSESSSSSLGSPGSATFSGSHSPFPPDATSPSTSWINLPQATSSSPFASEIFYEEPQISTPFDLAPLLVNLFAPHRHQCGLEVHMGHIRESLNLPLSEQRHPALMNAIYLWACFVSRPEPLCEHEEYFLNQALEAQQQGLRMADKVLDVIQASCLLSVYFLANGRLLEGSFHSSAAAALAVQIGLHLGVPQESPTGWMSDPNETYDLKPQKTDYLRGERVLAFWQVYNLDRCWSVVLRKPCVIPDGSSALSSVNCPWPQDIAEYESGYIDPSPTFRTLSGFLNGDVSSGGYSMQTLRAKASTLFAHADTIARSWDSDIKAPANIQDRIQVLEMTITTFLSTLTPVHQLDGTMSDQRQILITVHTLANTATILLFQRFAHEGGHAYEKCVQAANTCLSIVKSLSTSDFSMLDPILGTCWTTVVEVLVRQLDAIESAWSPVKATDLRTDLTTLLIAMTNFDSHFPILALPISKLKTRLEV